ncbi:MAG: hypothetical protein PHN31_06200 [Candidatus Gracilibacteria bacterium]|nr:hypothetical protein [Candidatus Gracilibacteria bacterium]
MKKSFLLVILMILLSSCTFFSQKEKDLSDDIKSNGESQKVVIGSSSPDITTNTGIELNNSGGVLYNTGEVDKTVNIEKEENKLKKIDESNSNVNDNIINFDKEVSELNTDNKNTFEGDQTSKNEDKSEINQDSLYKKYDDGDISFDYNSKWGIEKGFADTQDYKKLSISTENIDIGNFLGFSYSDQITIDLTYGSGSEIIQQECGMCFGENINRTYIDSSGQKIYLNIYINFLTGQKCLDCLSDDNFLNKIDEYNNVYMSDVYKVVDSIMFSNYSLFEDLSLNDNDIDLSSQNTESSYDSQLSIFDESLEALDDEELIRNYYDYLSTDDYKKAYEMKYDLDLTYDKFVGYYTGCTDINVLDFYSIGKNKYSFIVSLYDTTKGLEEKYSVSMEVIQGNKLKTLSSEKLKTKLLDEVFVGDKRIYSEWNSGYLKLYIDYGNDLKELINEKSYFYNILNFEVRNIGGINYLLYYIEWQESGSEYDYYIYDIDNNKLVKSFGQNINIGLSHNGKYLYECDDDLNILEFPSLNNIYNVKIGLNRSCSYDNKNDRIEYIIDGESETKFYDLSK